MLPGGKAISKAQENMDPNQFTKLEAMISSMNKKERANPEGIDFSRKKRIARGSGTTQQEVSNLLKQFFMMKKVMKKPSMMNDMMGSMGMPAMPGMGPMGGGGRGSNVMKKKSKRKKNKQKRR